MEQTMYIFFFCMALVMFFISMFYKKDWQLQVMFSTISFVLFTALIIEGLNVEVMYYDPNTPTITSYRYEDYYMTFGIPLIFSIISLLNGFIAATYKSMNVATKGLKTPKRF